MSWTSVVSQSITQGQQEQVIQLVGAELDKRPLDLKRDRRRLELEARPLVLSTLGRLGLMVDPTLHISLVQRVVARVGGLGFLNNLIPSKDFDPGYSEIMLNPDGTVWAQKKGAEHPIPLEMRPSLEEVWRAVESLMAPLGRSISETTPSVDAKLPRMEGMGGARVKIIHPNLVPGSGYPSINIRLFEPRPVLPEKLVEWNVAPKNVIDTLLEHVERKLRIFVIGGTGTGKTTLLAALCNGIPRHARVVKIEDPEEIWLDHPNVVTLEARPATVGSSVPAYTLYDGVNDAMRMSPKWLIVGEVRTGDAALALFNAQMSDHPGLSTYHAEGPEEAVFRLSVHMFQSKGVKMEAAKATFSLAVDLVVQIGWQDGRRQMVGVWEVDGLRGGDVRFNPLYAVGDSEMKPSKNQRR